MIIVALDFPDDTSALKCVDSLGERASFYKVGLQLFIAEGPQIVRELKSRGKKVFLDLKLHDIPNTVSGAVKSASVLGVDMMTVHAGGGEAMLRAAVSAASSFANPPLILAVSVLTSMDAEALRQVGVNVAVEEQVLSLVRLAAAAGCGGVVCSPQEVSAVRSAVGKKLTLVVPGIRPAGSAAGDQARIATPVDAIRSGADFLVIGRPITAAKDPVAALAAIKSELDLSGGGGL